MTIKNVARFKFIEAMILFHGGFNRRHIERAFGQASAASSRTVNAYKGHNPGVLFYKHMPRRMEATDAFEPLFLTTSPHEFLEAAQVMADVDIFGED